MGRRALPETAHQVDPGRLAFELDVRQDQRDVGQIGDQGGGLVGARGLDHGLPEIDQHVAHHRAQVVAVFDQQRQTSGRRDRRAVGQAQGDCAP